MEVKWDGPGRTSVLAKCVIDRDEWSFVNEGAADGQAALAVQAELRRFARDGAATQEARDVRAAQRAAAARRRA